jgi:hypothetical protein
VRWSVSELFGSDLSVCERRQGGLSVFVFPSVLEQV